MTNVYTLYDQLTAEVTYHNSKTSAKRLIAKLYQEFKDENSSDNSVSLKDFSKEFEITKHKLHKL